jgi:molybdopterin-guanine dinucleotide biosynthesis protein A
MYMKVTSIVLAGGKNLRLGRNKALETLDGKSLIEHVIERVEPLSGRILIVTSREKFDLPVSVKGEMLADLYPDKGPLGGIYTGLAASRSLYNLVVACDMPFLNTELLSYMLGLSRDYDAVVPRLEEEMIEPLHAIYSRDCLDNMKMRLESNELKVHSFLKTVRVRYIERDESQKLDPELLSFFNINHQSDIERAIALTQKHRL